MEKTVLIIGGSGLVGQCLGEAFTRAGYRVSVLGRSPERTQGLLSFPATLYGWSEEDFNVSPEILAAHEIIVNLGGASVFSTPWTKNGMRRMRESRVLSTRAVVEAIAKSSKKPSLFIQASAVGYYGDRGSSEIDENTAPGNDFLALLCKDWEAEVLPLKSLGVRCCVLRIGPVLSLRGGMLAELDPLYGAGFGANIGGGEHWVSWIHMEDLVGIFLRCMSDERFAGVYNATAPQPERYAIIHKELCAIKKNRGLPAPPKIILKRILGKKAEFLLGSQCALPRHLVDANFKFKFPDLHSALRDCYAAFAKRERLCLEFRQWIPADADSVWRFFSDEKNLEQITPPWLNFRVLGKNTASLGLDTEISYKLRLRGIPLRWESRIEEWTPPHRFIDAQIRGPYKSWRHQHEFVPLGEGVLAMDRIEYELPLGRLGYAAGLLYVRSDVAKIFSYRAKIIAKRFAALAK